MTGTPVYVGFRTILPFSKLKTGQNSPSTKQKMSPVSGGLCFNNQTAAQGDTVAHARN